jgi:hypothetical protein
MFDNIRFKDSVHSYQQMSTLFSAISQFVVELDLLYGSSKTSVNIFKKSLKEEFREKHEKAFNDFVFRNANGILNTDVSLFESENIKVTKSVILPIGHLLKTESPETTRTIWLYLLKILGIVNPESGAFEVFQKLGETPLPASTSSIPNSMAALGSKFDEFNFDSFVNYMGPQTKLVYQMFNLKAEAFQSMRMDKHNMLDSMITAFESNVLSDMLKGFKELLESGQVSYNTLQKECSESVQQCISDGTLDPTMLMKLLSVGQMFQ